MSAKVSQQNPVKLEKQQRSACNMTIARIRGDYSFGKIKSRRDLLRSHGYTEPDMLGVLQYTPIELEQRISRSEVWDYCEDLRLGLEAEIYLRNNPPDRTGLDELYETLSRTQQAEQDRNEIANSSSVPPRLTRDASSDQTDSAEQEKDYGLPPSAKEKATLFWFQKKGAKQMLDNLLVKKLQAQMLLSGVGTGKTFMFGAFLRRLVDIGYHIDKTFGPFPYCVVTKASIVEQTKRVLEKQFGLDCDDEVLVTNYDQLRSKFGQLFVKEELQIIGGEEHLSWKWRNNVYPIVFIFDECQSAKNEQSTQSQIVQTIADINNPNLHCVFSSATPGTRISEFKYFVLNCRYRTKMF